MSCGWRGHCDEAPPVHRLRHSFRHHRHRCGHGVDGEWAVVMVSASTIQRGGVRRSSTASQGATASFPDHHQAGAVCSASRRLRHARVYPYEFQFAGVPHPRQRPVRALSSQAAIRTGHPIHAVKLTLGLVQSRAGQPRSQFVAALVIHANRLSKISIRPHQNGRSNREWRYLKSVMRCPK